MYMRICESAKINVNKKTTEGKNGATNHTQGHHTNMNNICISTNDHAHIYISKKS